MRPRALVVAIVAIVVGAVAACGPSPNPHGNGDGGLPGQPDALAACLGSLCTNACPTGTQTTISGTVLAPNGIDPVPGALVYVPYTVSEFPPTIECEVCNSITDSALVSTVTAADGSFTLGPLPTPMDLSGGFTVTIV